MTARSLLPQPGLTPLALGAATLLAVDPQSLGGVHLKAAAGPLRDAWLAHLHALLPAAMPWHRLPLHIADERLLGGLDLPATLAAGHPVAQRGVLAQADGGVVVVAMAERLSAGTAARLAQVLDRGEVLVLRDGLSLQTPARVALVALDEGIAEEALPTPLSDRLALIVDLDAEPPAGERLTGPGLSIAPAILPPGSAAGLAATLPSTSTSTAKTHFGSTSASSGPRAEQVAAARARLPQVQCSDAMLAAMVSAAAAFGVDSARASWFALRVACIAAALAGRDAVAAEDAAVAVQWVLAPRATQLPAPAEPAPDETETPAAEAADPPGAEPPEPLDPAPASADDAAAPPPEAADNPPGTPDEPLQEQLIDATRAAIPAGLLALLQSGSGRDRRAATAGRAGAVALSKLRGRPVGARRGEPCGGARLNLMETLRAAAPWQRLRRSQSNAAAPAAAAPRAAGPDTGVAAAAGAATAMPQPNSPTAARQRVLVHRDDLHITRYQQRRATTTLFVLDASGSAALHRLAEAKGAVELLLADCYARRDQVAVLGFRGDGAQLLLPPTRSLVRARRSLAGLPGGGGTPLAAGLDAARSLAESVRRGGATPLVVVLTDGRANVGRDGKPGRERAQAEALQAARALAGLGCATLLVDTSPQPTATAQTLAVAMNARYLALPYAAAQALSGAVRAVRARPTGHG